MDSLGSGVIGFLVFMLTTPVRSEGGGVPSCVEGTPCLPQDVHCSSLLGVQDLLGPWSCSPWAAAATGLCVAVALRLLGRARRRPRRPARTR